MRKRRRKREGKREVSLVVMKISSGW